MEGSTWTTTSRSGRDLTTYTNCFRHRGDSVPSTSRWFRLGALLLLATFTLLGGPTGCRAEQYSCQYASYPPDSSPEDGDWEYMLVVTVSADHNLTRVEDKRVRLVVEDVQKRKLLDDKVVLRSARLRPIVTWETATDLQVELIEVGSPRSSDDYNATLVRNGARSRLRLNYHWNPTTKRYELR